jgi:hypothetical protein
MIKRILLPLRQQPWIDSPVADLVFIIAPPFVCLAAIIAWPGIFQQAVGMSDAWWAVLILLTDVAHVYSTLYRTYWDREAFALHKTKLQLIPLLGFIAGVLLYSFSSALFWRVLAYVAVFHFIRQQYGFVKIYTRKLQLPRWLRIWDTVTIYAATLYPLLYWHCSADRNFNWFVKNDFVLWQAPHWIVSVLGTMYITILLLYIIKEIWLLIHTGYFNWPKNAVVIGTVLSWYFGIVYFNGDMAFTLLNVISHGVPYMALIWMYGKKRVKDSSAPPGKWMKLAFGPFGWCLFLLVLFLLAYAEEGLWDMAVWKEHKNIFGIFYWIKLQIPDAALALLVPLLALPQITHYIIDGFIWRIKKNDLQWAEQSLTPTSHPNTSAQAG